MNLDSFRFKDDRIWQATWWCLSVFDPSSPRNSSLSPSWIAVAKGLGNIGGNTSHLWVWKSGCCMMLLSVLKWHRHTMLLSLSTYFRCLMPPSASNASSWATKNIVSRHEVKTYLGKSLKTTAFPVHCTLSLPKVTSDDSAECHLMKACFFKNKHVYKVYIVSSWARWPYQHHSLANWCPRLESLVVLSDRPNVLPQCTVFGSILTCSSVSNHGFGGWKLEQKSCH